MKRYAIVCLLAGLASGLISCSGSKQVASASSEIAPKPATRTGPDSQEVPFVASGPIVVENQVDVAAQREGVVLRTMAEPGLRVNKGQILAELDARQISADLEAARAKTRSIEADLKNWEAEAKVLDADYQRAQKMWDAQLITKEQLDHARYKAESDQWDVKRVQELLVNARHTERSLELELEKTRIRAPFSGIVARRYVREGQKVAMGDRLFWVTAIAPLRVKFTLPERFFGRVSKGEEINVTSEMQGRDHKAEVIEVSPVVDPGSGTFEVTAQLTGSPGDLRPGMTANIHFTNLR